MKLLKFEKDGCVPCKSVTTYLDSKSITYETVNPFKNPKLAIKFEVMSVPQLIVVDENDQEIKRSIGFKPEEIEEIINILNN